MNKAFRITLIVIGFLVVASGLVFAGTRIGRLTSYRLSSPMFGYRDGADRSDPVRGYGMMGNSNDNGNGYGMMAGGRASGSGMTLAPAACAGVGGGYGSSSAAVTPLTVDQAYQAAGKYLSTLNNSDLEIAEVMVFDNNAYVRVVEKSTGIGAFELLVDPATLAVYPEHGPNMMWNLKYSGLNHQNMMGGRRGMMGGNAFSTTPSEVSAAMTVSSAQALQAAQQYLDTNLPGTKTASDADPFYGYYTIDILRDGRIIGMLSVNGFSSQVFMHIWHGTFIATQDY